MQSTRCLAARPVLLALTVVASEPADPPKTEADVLAITSVPGGHYLVNLQQGGQERHISLLVTGGSARCVNSTDPKLKRLEGTFQSIGNSVFHIALRNENHTASQWWPFQEGRHRHREGSARPRRETTGRAGHRYHPGTAFPLNVGRKEFSSGN
ncbi:MAG TPA: hypothetical protein GYA07_04125 [Verrucomicrobia bacterium]|nr:hypothetical protein [Verrucomicrobiota bacterium]HOP96814.1 hypothetical protein [Verrucomicrobiota bacterium]HPU57370.1 hypothetical protein [Verrucomicrobiota bacterium]